MSDSRAVLADLILKVAKDAESARLGRGGLESYLFNLAMNHPEQFRKLLAIVLAARKKKP